MDCITGSRHPERGHKDSPVFQTHTWEHPDVPMMVRISTARPPQLAQQPGPLHDHRVSGWNHPALWNTAPCTSGAWKHGGGKRMFCHCSLSCVQLFVTPWTSARQVSLSFTISQSLRKLISVQSVMPSNHLILCCRLLFLPSVFPSIGVFFSEAALDQSVCVRWLKDWSFSFSISPSN